MFGVRNEKNIMYNFAQHCRDDENLCGKNATFHEKLEIGIKVNENQNELIPKNITDDNDNSNTYIVSGKLIKILDDEMKKLINDYYNFLRNDNDW